MCHGVVEMGPLAVPSRMRELQFPLSTLELGLKENSETKKVHFLSLSTTQSHRRSSNMETSPGTLGILFFPDTINMEPILVYIYTLQYFGVYVELSCTYRKFACMLYFLVAHICGCVYACVYAYVCVCVFVCECVCMRVYVF